MEATGSLPAPDPGALPGDLAAALAPLVERVYALLPRLQASDGGTLLAVFDSGPGQLGSPRVGQVAGWIALARRARAAGLRFLWGILQEPGEEPTAGTSAEDLRRLLSSRTPHEAGGEQLAAWRERLKADSGVVEAWLIGPPRLGSSPPLPGASRLQIWDDLTPGARRIGVTLYSGSEIAARDFLDLPDETDCASLLRLAPSPPGFALSSTGEIDIVPERPFNPLESGERRLRIPVGRTPDPWEPANPSPGEPARKSRRFFHRLKVRTALTARFSRVISRHHAAYLRRLKEMFESGDFETALHYAVPLGMPATAAGPMRLPLRPLSPRSELRIRPEVSQPWFSSGISPEVYGELRRLYREAFRRMESQERIEEAAFLLAEVLHSHEEAVGFLERHGRFLLAAEMAEARHLPPGLVVRQWLLAGNRERALRIARRSGDFADAVTRLERSRQPEQAHELRRLWAQGLAGRGDYAAAVEALWPLESDRPRALSWMDRAIEQGGVPAGRMLARKAALEVEPFEKVRDLSLALLESWRAEGAAARLAFADTLRRGPRTPATQSLARVAVRALARDSGRLGARLKPAALRQLVTFAGDAALKMDAPALPLQPREPWISNTKIWRVEITARDGGTRPAHDAAFLPNGLTAVALGEAGVWLMSRDGRTVAELDPPAHRLVVSDYGDRAVALARRGEVWRANRIDFVSRTAEDWRDVRLETFASSFDGSLWFVTDPNGLTAVDTDAEGFDGAWGTPLPGPVLMISRSPTHCSLLVDSGEPEIWTYELPSLTLRGREPVPARGLLASRCLGLSPEGRLLEPPAALLPPGSKPLPPSAAGDWIAYPVHTKSGILIHLLHRPSGGVRAEVVLERSTRVTLHLTPQTLTLADDRGRVLVLDLEYGQMRRDLRL